MDSMNKWGAEKWLDVTARYKPSDIFKTDETTVLATTAKWNSLTS